MVLPGGDSRRSCGSWLANLRESHAVSSKGVPMSKYEPRAGRTATTLDRMWIWSPAGMSLALALAGCQAQTVNSLDPLPVAPDGSLDAFDAFEGGASPGDGAPDTPPCPGAGLALSFDGVQARVIADLGGSLPTGNSARTVEMWAYVRPTSWAVNRHTLFEYGAGMLHQAWAIDMDLFPTMQVYSWDDDIFFDTGLAEPEGWLHVAATYDGKIMRAFLNGVERGSKQPTDLLATTQTNVRIAYSLPTDAHFDGIIDEVRIWNVARTADEIKSTMSVRLTGNEPWLVALWHFDEGDGTTAADSSTMHNDATLEFNPVRVPSGVKLECPH
jgi:hypothetical protein